VIGHHLKDSGEGNESEESGIEALLLGGIGEGGACEAGVLR
jgi:hypothetical protein